MARVVGVAIAVELGPVPTVASLLHDGDDLEIGTVPTVLDDDGFLRPTSERLGNDERLADDVVYVDVDAFAVRSTRRTASGPAVCAPPASIVVGADAREEAARPSVVLVVSATSERSDDQGRRSDPGQREPLGRTHVHAGPMLPRPLRLPTGRGGAQVASPGSRPRRRQRQVVNSFHVFV